MQKIRLLSSTEIDGEQYVDGQTLELSDAAAQGLIDSGVAEAMSDDEGGIFVQV